VVGQDKSFYFLEMNTRLQVEHPVTELVTGIDLVEQMIRVAAGEKLALKQDDVALAGWAVESRVYAEDPDRNFLPSIGRLARYRPPAESRADGITVRNDTGVYEGGEISVHYDPMIAKLVTHASTRAGAIAAQADALDAFAIDGVQHNIPFLAAVMQHPRWRAGKLSTGFIAEEYPHGFHARPPEGETARVLAAVAAAVDHVAGARKRKISGQMHGRLVAREKDRVVVLSPAGGAIAIGDGALGLRIEDDGETLTVRYRGGAGPSGNAPAGETFILKSPWRPGDVLWAGTVDEQAIAVQVRPVPNGFHLTWRGARTWAYVYTEREAAAARLMPVKALSDSGKRVLCPMPGLVVSIAVAEGQEVKVGETLAVVEAMKMENVLRAERDGTVKAIRARPGETLAVDSVILEFV
jgi:propionyl-CoA carboxylase alpha subunit